MLSSPSAMNLFGIVQSGVSRLQNSVHHQLHQQFGAGESPSARPARDVVISTSGETVPSLFVTAASGRHDTRAVTSPSVSNSALVTRNGTDASDLLLTAFDGVSLQIASYLDAQDLYNVQLVNRSWRAFIVANRDALYGSLLEKDFQTVIRSSSPFKSYIFSQRHELEKELLHTKAIQPTYAALETYCSTTEPSNHGFIAMFGDIFELTDPRVARFVGFKRHHALSVVLAATPEHVNAFRKRSEYTRPIAFVPVINPNWPEFDLPPVEFPGFLGYAFDFVKMVPGYESLKDTVVKSILRDLMVFDTSESAAAYGISIGRQPFIAVLDESFSNPSFHMTFSSPLRRRLSKLSISERIRSIEERIQSIDACVIHTIV
uniref:F-box domain-containing protein n=1 Tax=Globisporangium ultimum (strain ATCC 200006 / CBS 805.95 / DAOM BR144) TaxID=431595 RepID=K3WDA9_GLOUD